MNRYVLDVEGFLQPGKRIVVKELCVLPIDCAQIPKIDHTTYLFKPPYPWKRLSAKYREINTWLMKNHHGIRWEDGALSYSDVSNILRENLCEATMVYVNGPDRKEWLEEILLKNEIKCPIMDIRELGFIEPISNKRIVTLCHNHIPIRRVICALHHAKLMRDYAHLHIDAMEWEDVGDWCDDITVNVFEHA